MPWEMYDQTPVCNGFVAPPPNLLSLNHHQDSSCTQSCMCVKDLTTDLSSMLTVNFFQVSRHKISLPIMDYSFPQCLAVHPRFISLDDMWEIFLCKRLDTLDQGLLLICRVTQYLLIFMNLSLSVSNISG